MFPKKLFSVLTILIGMAVSFGAYGQKIAVRGTVTDASGPVVGAAVLSGGTGAVTDADGSFSISVDPNAVLEVSCLGYVSQQVPVQGRRQILVVLEEDQNILEDAVVVGYGTQKKANLTGAVSVVKADDLKGYTLRKVEDAGSLIEKVRIFEAGLDDAAIEMCKFVSGKELNAKGLRFRGFAGADNEMEFIFPRNGQMNSVKVGFNVYEDSQAILARNPSIIPAELFPKIDSNWTDQVFG